VLCHEAVERLSIPAASAWLYDRRSQELVLAATSGRTSVVEGTRLRADSPDVPSASLRDEKVRPHAAVPDHPAMLTIPLRGRRRALGVLVLDLAPGGGADAPPEWLDEAEELGRQLSPAIENLLLLEDLLRSRRELAHTFDSLEDLVAICDSHLRVLQVNRMLADRLVLPRDRMVARPLVDLVGADAARWLATLAQSDSLQTATATEAREIDDAVLGGRFTMTVTPLPGTDGRTTGAVFVARDITNQARLEAERAALRERLTQSEKLAALGQFIAGIAHELNNPLQGVLGHLELLREQGRIPADIRRELGLVFREADRAARIVDNLLVFAGGRRAALRPVSLNTIVSQTVAMRTTPCRAAHIDIVQTLDASHPRVSGNRLMLQQALFNILLNAEQELAGRGGGRIDITTRLVEGGRSVRLEVRDTGGGIPPDALPRLFEPFYTTKDVGRGTGLGLAITYGIVKDHRGLITAANHPSGGAVFTIDLPVLAPTAGKRRTKA
jgi:two-component system, NtrC family, sensor kinase